MRDGYTDEDSERRITLRLNTIIRDRDGRLIEGAGYEWDCKLPSVHDPSRQCSHSSWNRNGGSYRSTIAPAYKSAGNADRGWERHARSVHDWELGKGD